MYYGSRFAPKQPTGARPAPVRPTGRTLAEALRDPAAVIRIRVVYDQAQRPRWVVDAWTARYEPYALDQAAQQRLFELWRGRWPSLNWWRPVQIDLRGGRVSAAPAVEDMGGIPSLDESFGEPLPPVMADERTPPYPWAVAEQLRRAA